MKEKRKSNDSLLIALPGNEHLRVSLASALGVDDAALTLRRFPDGESYARLDTPCAGRDVLLLASLARPDDKLLPLLFVADLTRELDATRVVLVAPYLPYMRQDKRFAPGEAVTSRSFAGLISSHVDALVTVDPHLHRYGSLGELYTVPSRVAHAAPAISAWIKDHVPRPLLIGPDSESEQWVADVAKQAGGPYVILDKVRTGDRTVKISVPQVERWRDHQPVLVDDIISTARTMIETVRHVNEAGLRPPYCIGVHGIFADDAYPALTAAGAARVITSNTIFHETNSIDLTRVIEKSVREVLDL